MDIGNNSANRLLSLIERIERLQDEQKLLGSDIVEVKREVKREAKSAGFDLKVINQMLRERRMTSETRAEWQAQCEIYRAALGMLDGTPLGNAARKRFDPPSAPEPGEPPPADMAVAPGDLPPAYVVPTADEIEAAREEGRTAHAAGLKVTQNPYPFVDPRRAAWDEGWCTASGSDGMELPDAWRRSKPSKSEQPEAPPAAPDAAASDPAPEPEPTLPANATAPRRPSKKAAGQPAKPAPKSSSRRRGKKPDDTGAAA